MQKDLHIRAVPINKGDMLHYFAGGVYIGMSFVKPGGELFKSEKLLRFIKDNNLNHHDSKPSHPGSN